MFNEEKMREQEREAIKAHLGDTFAFSVPEAAKKLNRSRNWAYEKVLSGKLRSVWLDGHRVILAPTLAAALEDGI